MSSGITTAKTVPPWPLPADYYELTTDGKRECRLGILRDRSAPDKLVSAWWLLRNWYLNWPGSHFYKEFKPSPPMHRELIEFAGRYRLNAVASPRNHAKSTVIGREWPLLEALCPSIKNLDILFLLAKDDMVEERINDLMMQFQHNQRIIDDFGKMRPTRGENIWNRHILKLNNRVTLKGRSMESRKRGDRVDIAIIDDPEFDPEEGTNIQIVSRNLNTVVKRQVMGMLSPHSRLYWIGTLLHARSYLYHILKSEDPAFRRWNKKIYDADIREANGKMGAIWEERISREFLDEQRETMGTGAYRAEYGNDPRSDDESVLRIEPSLNEYHLVNHDDSPTDEFDPLHSPVLMRYTSFGKDMDGKIKADEITVPYGQHVRGLKRYMCVDYSMGEDEFADYSAIIVWGLDSRNTIWVLSAWQGKVRQNELVQKIWTIGKKWGVHTVGVEAVAMQDAVRQQVADFMGLIAQTGEWTPRVRGIRYPFGVSKEDRIAGLEWRFEKGRIKFPSWLATTNNERERMKVLYEQIEAFTPDLANLSNDDLVDSLSMAHYMFGGSGNDSHVKITDEKDLIQRMLNGELYLREAPQIPIMSSFSWSELNPEVIDKLEQMYRKNPTRTTREHANNDAPYVDDDYSNIGDPNDYN